jgi:hypothetical protein
MEIIREQILAPNSKNSGEPGKDGQRQWENQNKGYMVSETSSGLSKVKFTPAIQNESSTAKGNLIMP